MFLFVQDLRLLCAHSKLLAVGSALGFMHAYSVTSVESVQLHGL